MAIPKKLLVPVDFSRTSLAALELALEVMSRFGASLELLHVWEPPPIHGPGALFAGGAAPLTDMESHALRAAQREMNELVERLHRRGFPGVPGSVKHGVPADVIVDVAGKNGFDLIVMGTEGRTGISRLLGGSVAGKVVRSSPVPVLTVRQRESDAVVAA